MKKLSEIKFVKPNLKKIEAKMVEITNEFENAKTFEEQNAAFKKMNKYSDHLQTNFVIASIRYSCDTENEENVKNQEYLDEILPHITNYYNKFNKALVNAKFKKELEEKWGTYLFKKAQVALETFDESIIPELQEENKLTSEYTKIIASAQIEFRGKVYNLSQLGRFAQDADRDTRKEAAILSAKWIRERD